MHIEDTQLNFITAFRKGKHGIIKSIKEVYDIMRVSRALQGDYPAFRKVVATQLRLLLCDNSSSLIYKMYENPMLPPLAGKYVSVDTELYIHPKIGMFNLEAERIGLDDWLKQDIMFFKRTRENLAISYHYDFFQQILNKLRGEKKTFIQSMYHIESRNCNGQDINFFVINNNIQMQEKQKLFDIINEIGYNNLDIRTLIKLVADKEGAHIDLEHPTGLIFADISSKNYNFIDGVADMIIGLLEEYLKMNEL